MSGFLRVGVALDVAPPPGVSFAGNLETLCPVLDAGDRLQFDSLFVGESYVFRPGDPMGFHAPNSLLTLASLAGRTTIPVLGTAALLIAAWTPMRLAYDVALLDQLTAGRLVLGVGLGGPALWTAMGRPKQQLGVEMERTIRWLRRVWAGEEIGSGSSGVVVPAPAQPGGPKVWIGGALERSALRAATLGDGYVVSTCYPFELVQRQAAIYHEAAGNNGIVSVNRIAIIASTDEEAERWGRQFAARLLDAYWSAGAFPGVERETAYDALAADVCLIGSPDTVRQQLVRYQQAGVTHVQLRVRPAHMPVERSVETLERFAAIVRPLLGPPSRATH